MTALFSGWGSSWGDAWGSVEDSGPPPAVGSSSLAIAVQGIGFGAFLVAVQGFAPIATELPVPVPIVSQVAGGGGTSMSAYDDELERMVRKQILEEDEIIVMAVAKMIANGALG